MAATRRVASVAEVRRLAEQRLTDARSRDEHVNVGLARVSEDRLWEFFIQQLDVLAETVKRQAGG